MEMMIKVTKSGSVSAFRPSQYKLGQEYMIQLANQKIAFSVYFE